MPYLQQALDSAFGDGNPQEKGKAFELALCEALKKHPGDWGQSRFEQVWHWRDWPAIEEYFPDRKDRGIDLVARNTQDYGGGLVAIQAKYGKSEIPTEQIDSFLATASSNIFQNRVLVAERNIAKAGEVKLENAGAHVLRLKEIDDWVKDWRRYIPNHTQDIEIEFPQHELRGYQRDALDAIAANFEVNTRGKLVLPCGTGKSFVALKAAEENAGRGKSVLYLVPSISLMGQTMREWSRHSSFDHQYIGICSDITAGRDLDKRGSYIAGQYTELTMPVTTDLEKIKTVLRTPVPRHRMRVVFSTYQSSPKIQVALQDPDLEHVKFDLAICDEAHRTTGIEALEQSKSRVKPFQLIHQDEEIRVSKRLYMTATPRVFAENIRKRMAESNFDGQSYSMDDESVYGPEAYRMNFADAIDGGWLSDYKVVVIGVSEQEYFNRAKDNPIRFEDGKLVDANTVVRLAGCWDALATPQSQAPEVARDLGQLEENGLGNAKTAIAFTSTVKDSKLAEKLWQPVADWTEETKSEPDASYLKLSVQHLDANTPASERSTMIEGLREMGKGARGECKVLTNVGVLTEGVDVPALDAVVFLQSRSSPVDVTQAVGRVMRKAEGKEFGYVVIPVVVPTYKQIVDEDSAASLIDETDFKPVFDVIRALRSHDERIDHMLEARTMPVELRISTGGGGGGGEGGGFVPTELELRTAIEQLNSKLGSIMLDACGDRHMYPNWGTKAGAVCETIEVSLNALVENNEHVRSEFEIFHKSLTESVSPDISFDQTVRMVSHHLVTVPVFDELFSESMFAERNPITQSMSAIRRTINEAGTEFSKEREPLRRAYSMMNEAYKAADSPRKRLDVLREIFDGFFRKAMPGEVKTMGIAYTPIELVDFMIKSVDTLCRKEFGKGLTDRDVHILDPFAGTGTFLAHLLECKDPKGDYLIRDEDLNRKYQQELHANELVLLAYYIAALKIEETKHRRTAEAAGVERAQVIPYESFDRIVLADTFHMGESSRELEMVFDGLAWNTLRAKNQIEAPIRVIFGNPPWSAGRDDSSEVTRKTAYEGIAERIRSSYGEANRELNVTAAKALGNLFVAAFRWATDRLIANKNKVPAIIAFVSPNSLTDGTSLAGMRKVLRDEFSDIYVVNLRGNALKAGEAWQIEGDKVFGESSRNGVQITLLIRNPKKSSNAPATLRYAMVPERLKLNQKLEWLGDLSVESTEQFHIVPETPEHDWINLQDPSFKSLLPVCKGLKSRDQKFIADFHCLGITTACDTYVYAFSKADLERKIRLLIDEFNRCAVEYESSGYTNEKFTALTRSDSLAKIKWTDKLKKSLQKRKKLKFEPERVKEALYRPFTKCYLYEDFGILTAGKSAADLFKDKQAGTPPRSTSEQLNNSRLASSQANVGSTSIQQDERRDSFSSGDPSSVAIQSFEERNSLNKTAARSTRGESNEDPSVREVIPPPRKILVSSPSNKAIFGCLATNKLADLCSAGTQQANRLIAP